MVPPSHILQHDPRLSVLPRQLDKHSTARRDDDQSDFFLMDCRIVLIEKIKMNVVLGGTN
jgi:hypothetical protein